MRRKHCTDLRNVRNVLCMQGLTLRYLRDVKIDILGKTHDCTADVRAMTAGVCNPSSVYPTFRFCSHDPVVVKKVRVIQINTRVDDGNL
jgi:hypothetical protein